MMMFDGHYFVPLFAVICFLIVTKGQSPTNIDQCQLGNATNLTSVDQKAVSNAIVEEDKKVNVRYIVGLTVGAICLVVGIILMLYLTGGEPPQTVITSEDAQVIIGVDNGDMEQANQRVPNQ